MRLKGLRRLKWPAAIEAARRVEVVELASRRAGCLWPVEGVEDVSSTPSTPSTSSTILQYIISVLSKIALPSLPLSLQFCNPLSFLLKLFSGYFRLL